MPHEEEMSFCINGKRYTIDEVSAIHRFFQDCVDRGDVAHALSEALAGLFNEDTDIAEFGRNNFQQVYEECLKRLPLWKYEREDFLNEAEWAYRHLAAVVVRDMHAQKGENGK